MWLGVKNGSPTRYVLRAFVHSTLYQIIIIIILLVLTFLVKIYNINCTLKFNKKVQIRGMLGELRPWVVQIIQFVLHAFIFSSTLILLVV